MSSRMILVLGMLSLLLGGCSSQGAIAPTPSSIPLSTPSNAGVPTTSAGMQNSLQVSLVPSELIVGPNRFAVGLIDPPTGMIHDAAVHFRYFDLSDPTAPTLESEADAVRMTTSDGETTYYAQEREFKHAGDWGVDVRVRLADGTLLSKQIGFRVVENSPTLKPGAKAPPLKTRTAADVGNDLTKLTSAVAPDPAFYQLSLAQAISNGKPTVLVFATPAFCQTRMCGPTYDVARAAQTKYGDAANFIHVEVYSGLPNPAANGFQLDVAMKAFGLTTEPWVFLIDKRGVIAWRVEGPVVEDEIEQQLEPLLQN